MRILLATVSLSTGLCLGCSVKAPHHDAPSAVVSFAISNRDLSGGSVRICGSRPAPTPGPTVACSAALDSCPCYDFDAMGNPVDPNTGAAAAVAGLCPSSVQPAAPWTFSYDVFDHPSCQGTQLNDGAHSLVCFDADDLHTQANPNQSLESLAIGPNTNHVLCLTDTSLKSWHVENCTGSTSTSGQRRYDCGCIDDAGTCDCGEGGATEDDLEPGCVFDAACRIVCNACRASCSSAADCDDGNDCTEDLCRSGICSNVPLARGAACDDGTCDDEGACVPACTRDLCAAGACSAPHPLTTGLLTRLAVEPQEPFGAIQYGTNGCIEVGVRPDPPYNQPKPLLAPDTFDVTSGYPPYGYDPSDFTVTSGINSCRYNFRDAGGMTIGSAYCVQFGAGQRSTTGYDPEPTAGIRNAGYVRRILRDYWPATDAPTVPSTNATVINRQRSGAVAMAIHFFTDLVVMPPNYQDAAIYAAVAEVVDGALAAGALEAAADPTPAITGPNGGATKELIGPYTIGANALGDLTVTVTGAAAFRDAGGTQPFPSGSQLAPGSQLWLRSSVADTAVIRAVGPVLSDFGTLMVGDPSYRVQMMMLAQPLTLTGKSEKFVSIDPDDPPRVSSTVAALVLEVGQNETDEVRIAGLIGDGTLTGSVFGPLPPIDDTCLEVDWSSATTIAVTFGPLAVTGDTTLDSPTFILSQPGCYSVGLRLTTAGGDIELAPGDATESMLVVPREPPDLDVTTAACPQRLRAGASAVDQVSVTGLVPNTAVVVTSLLYGPVTPIAADGCDGVDWTDPDLPIAATLPPVTITADRTYATSPVPIAAPGCYSFAVSVTHDVVTGGEEPVIKGLGAPEEVIFVKPAVPGPCAP